MLQNKYRVVGEVAYISLTRGQETVIDAIDLAKVLEMRWCATPNVMGGFYAMNKSTRETVYLHRFLMDAPRGTYVDHRNHDTLDNRRTNLRLTTNQENNVNRNGAFKTSETGIRGVSSWRAKTSKQKLYYVFRCHCVTCKVCKYFPHDEAGLDAARAFAEAHYAAMKHRSGVICRV